MSDVVSISSLSDLTTYLNLYSHAERHAVWIDGLCINQDDPDDKALQVSQMGSVYESADMVMTVLNTPTTETDFMLDHRNWTTDIESSQRDRMHRTMVKLLANDYWRRTWILQELVLAPKHFVCCGKRTLSFEDLSALFHRLRSHQSLTQFARGVARNFGTLLKSNVASDSESHDGADGGTFDERDLAIFSSEDRRQYRHVPFLDLLDKTRRYNRCYDTKDMLYARRGLASDGEQLIPTIHYGKDWTVEDVYKNFAMRCVTSSSRNCLRIIAYTTWYTEEPLPSWVPDWRVPSSNWRAASRKPSNDHGPDGNRNENLRKHQGNDLLRLRWNDKHVNVSVDGNELTVSGRILATITRDHLNHFESQRSAIISTISTQLRQHHSLKPSGLPPNPPRPAVGDIICALRGCPAFVFLQRADNRSYKIIAQHTRFQQLALEHCLGDLVSTELIWAKNGKATQYWSFRDMDAVNQIEEGPFIIV